MYCDAWRLDFRNLSKDLIRGGIRFFRDNHVLHVAEFLTGLTAK
jgi:hypothetical protein